MKDSQPFSDVELMRLVPKWRGVSRAFADVMSAQVGT